MSETTVFIYRDDSVSFVDPYLRREFSPAYGLLVSDEATSPPQNCDTAVMLSSTDIYLSDADNVLDESAAVDAASPWYGSERAFADCCHRHRLRPFILRAAPIAGTGMTGEVRLLAEDVASGRFVHLPGNDARRSVVHAVDVAAAAKMLCDSTLPGGTFNVSDGAHPTVHDLAEAIAFRLNNKRISTASTAPQQWFVRLVYGRRRLARYTTAALFSSAALAALGHEPRPVCRYMTTHNYDESSL